MKCTRLISILVASLTSISAFASHERFVTAYKDRRNNLVWSQLMPGVYTNGCADTRGKFDAYLCNTETDRDGYIHVKISDSDAAKACKDIGARLPTWQEIQSLLKNFDHTEKYVDGLRLTIKGREQMAAAFGDTFLWLWSSLVDSYDRDFAFVLAGDRLYKFYRHDNRRGGVRCVSSR